MVELVFIIALLGILATVALPRLMATRDDARAISMANEIKTTMDDIVQYYLTHGEFSTVRAMSRSASSRFMNIKPIFGSKIIYDVEGKACVGLVIQKDADSYYIRLEPAPFTPSGECRALQSTPIYKMLQNKKIYFSGTRVKF